MLSGAAAAASPGDTVIIIHNDELEVQTAGALEDDDDDDDAVDNEDFNEISVPLTIVLSVITGYIVFGTVLFGLWEGWKMDTAAYYCFITISTIGFGDVVPLLSRPEDEYKLIAVCTYMLFGTATLSMCFTLAQDQIAAKFRMVGEKCGFMKRFKRSSKAEDDVYQAAGEVDRRSTRRRSMPLQPVTTVPAAGTEVFENRRRKRVQRLKFNLSRKGQGRHRTRSSSASTSSSPGDDDRRLGSDSVFDDDDAVAMTTASGTVVEPRPSTSHVITINGTAHPVRDNLTPGELAQLRQRAAATSRSAAAAAVRRRSNDGPTTTTYDIQKRPLPDIAEERL